MIPQDMLDPLALDGGPPVREIPFPQRGHVGREEKAADYAVDPDRALPCPNAQAVMEACFNLYIHESWGPAEVAVRIR